MAETKENTAQEKGTVVMKGDNDVIILNDDDNTLFAPDISGLTKKKDDKVDGEGEGDGKKKPVEEGIDTSEFDNPKGEGEGEEKPVEEEESLTPFAKGLVEAGVLPNLDIEKFDGTLDGVFEAVGNEIALGIKSYKESLPKAIKDMVDNYEDDVPLDKLINIRSRQMDVKSIDEESLKDDISKQKKIVTDFLRLKGFKEKKIDDMVAKYEEIGDLFDESKEALVELKEHYTKEEEKVKIEAKADKKKREDAAARMLESIKKSVDTSDEIIPGIKINKQTKDKVYQSITDIVDYTDDGRPISAVMKMRMKDPVKFDITLNYLASLGVFEGKWDTLKGVIKNGVVKDISEKTQTKVRDGASASENGQSTSSDILKGIRKFVSLRQ